MVTVAEEVQRALQLASVNNCSPVPQIIPPGTSSLCGISNLHNPPNPSETSGPSMSPDPFVPLQMSPAFSVNSSRTYSDSLARVKIDVLEVKEPKGHEEDAGTETGLFSSWPRVRIITFSLY